MCTFSITTTMFTQNETPQEVLQKILKNPQLGVFFQDYLFYDEEKLQEREAALWQIVTFDEEITTKHKLVFSLLVREKISGRVDRVLFYVNPARTGFCVERLK